VYNPDRTEEDDLVDWHTWFAKPAGLKDSQVRTAFSKQFFHLQSSFSAIRCLFWLIPPIALLRRSLCVSPPSPPPSLRICLLIAWHPNFHRRYLAAKALSKIQCTLSSLGPSNSEVIDTDTAPLTAAFESLLAGVGALSQFDCFNLFAQLPTFA